MSQNQSSQCSKCGGTGSIEISSPCANCKGTGKGGEALLWKSRDKKSPFRSNPACLSCKGTGKIIRRAICPQCNGTGRAAASGSKPQKTKIVRADFSLWEKFLAQLHFKPEANCRPQRILGGSYPLIAKYIEISANPAYKVRVVKWERARLEGAEWIVGTTIEYSDKDGQTVRQEKEFIVENREVKGIRNPN